MTQQPQPASAASVSTLADARKLSDGLMEVMTTLLDLIENETALVRAGQVREAMLLEPRKTDLSRSYVSAIEQLKRSHDYFTQSAPDLLATLHRHHDVFRAMLQVNLTVLATAHAVSEGIIRGVNGEMQKKNMPQTYTAAGQRSTPSARHAAPLTISRTM